MEGYTARDALIVMRLDLADSLGEIDQELAELEETLEFSGIAEQLLDDESLTDLPAIKRWLDTVSNHPDLERDREELMAEREELVEALDNLAARLTGNPETSR
ncbi:MAG: hypothetical protein ACRDFS_08820 [Chloroflexota bacterium]